tara:strand:+ start:116 stop:484 length:369 start_codon:yes stop_codon:yes gene_type:complete
LTFFDIDFDLQTIDLTSGRLLGADFGLWGRPLGADFDLRTMGFGLWDHGFLASRGPWFLTTFGSPFGGSLVPDGVQTWACLSGGSQNEVKNRSKMVSLRPSKSSKKMVKFVDFYPLKYHGFF